MISTELILVRHGQTRTSAVRALCGRTDVPLNEDGVRQATLVGERLGAHKGRRVFTSPAARCRATAEAIVAQNGGPVSVLPDLWEVDYGDWEGMTPGEAQEKDPDLYARWRADPSVPTPGGESAMLHATRVARARDVCVAEGPAIVVAHAFTIKQIIKLALDVPWTVLPRIIVQPGSLSIVEFDSTGLGALITLNDVQHLERESDGNDGGGNA